MKYWGCLLALGAGLFLGQACHASEPALVGINELTCRNGVAKKCGATLCEWLCYRPLRVPRECRSCLSVTHACVPPLYVYFLPQYRFMTTANVPDYQGPRRPYPDE